MKMKMIRFTAGLAVFWGLGGAWQAAAHAASVVSFLDVRATVVQSCAITTAVAGAAELVPLSVTCVKGQRAPRTAVTAAAPEEPEGQSNDRESIGTAIAIVVNIDF